MKKVLISILTCLTIVLGFGWQSFAYSVTWNPNDKSNNITLSNGNLTINGTYRARVRATVGKSSGKWYWETTINERIPDNISGVSSLKYELDGYTENSECAMVYDTVNLWFVGTVSPINKGACFATGDVIGYALDMDNGNLTIYQNNVLRGTIENIKKYFNTAYPIIGGNTTTNFGATSFKYPLPKGYLPYDNGSNLVINTPTLNINSLPKKIKVGDEFTTEAVFQNVYNVYAEDFKINYDNTLFKYEGYEEVTGYKVCNTPQDNNGSLRFTVASKGKSYGINGNKTVIKLKFKAIAVGTGKVDALKARVADTEKEYDIDDINCLEDTVVVEASKDVNRSGEYTLLDLALDGYYYGMNASDTDTTKYDADQDDNNSIDDRDLTLIVQQMLNNQNYTPNKY